jgi:hypothetical protein
LLIRIAFNNDFIVIWISFRYTLAVVELEADLHHPQKRGLAVALDSDTNLPFAIPLVLERGSMNSIEIKDFADFSELLSTFVPDRLKQRSPSIMIVKEKRVTRDHCHAIAFLVFAPWHRRPAASLFIHIIPFHNQCDFGCP